MKCSDGVRAKRRGAWKRSMPKRGTCPTVLEHRGDIRAGLCYDC